ncbi:hypothetical protein DL764_009406 [Monosporascus ibericus]|uniref:Uncharacterized protein n=1 Tax=Monosporascus ibericus TaxID=155417 RepID=A0A4V1X8Z8_9PEZI|nr:hypothetical protein DL764_009406 [Monosporascus ibericus]
MGIASGVTHFVESILEVLQGLAAAILHFFQLALDSAIGLFRGFVGFVEGTLGFAFHNFFIIGTLIAVVLGYMMYTQRQGTAPASRAVKQK